MELNASNPLASVDRAQYLLLIIDVNPMVWMSEQFMKDGRSTFFDVIDQIFMFINAFLLLNRDNKVAIIATHPDQNELVFSELIPSDLDDPVACAADDPLLSLRPLSQAHFAAATARLKLIRYATEMTPTLEAFLKARISPDSTSPNYLNPNPALSSSIPIDLQTHEYPPSLVAGALSMGLCYLRRLSRLQQEPNSLYPPNSDSRMLILQASQDDPKTYVSMMNAIFSALQLRIPLNSIMLAPSVASTSTTNPATSLTLTTSTADVTPTGQAITTSESVFLQQAGYITKATYTRVVVNPITLPGTDFPLKDVSSTHGFSSNPLLQHLIMTYLADSDSASVLATPKRGDVDLRAACHCHKKVIDSGVFCPVCLAVYCTPLPQCSLCGSKFPYIKARPQRQLLHRPSQQPQPGQLTPTAGISSGRQLVGASTVNPGQVQGQITPGGRTLLHAPSSSPVGSGVGQTTPGGRVLMHTVRPMPSSANTSALPSAAASAMNSPVTKLESDLPPPLDPLLSQESSPISPLTAVELASREPLAKRQHI